MARTPFKRTARVASLVRQVLGELLTFEIKDPRVQGVVVSDVEVTGDLREARVFLLHPGDEAQAEQMMRGLNAASGFLRRELGQRIRLRVTPSLDFRFDHSIEYGARIESRLRELGLGGGGEDLDASTADGDGSWDGDSDSSASSDDSLDGDSDDSLDGDSDDSLDEGDDSLDEDDTEDDAEDGPADSGDEPREP